MQLPDELKFIERYLGWLNYQPSGSGMIRIGAWTGLFLILINIAAPAVPVRLIFTHLMAAQGLTDMSSAISDPRWGRYDIKTMQSKDKTSIAWIAGSSIMIPPEKIPDIAGTEIAYRFIPGFSKTALKNKHGIDTEIFVYMKLGRRILDTYNMALDAIEKKPDSIVLTINPFWEFNDWEIFLKPNLMNHGTRVWPKNGDWMLSLALLSPGNMLWGAAGQHFPLIRAGNDYLKAINKQAKSILNIDLKSLKAAPKDKNENALRFDYTIPLSFWIPQRFHNGDISLFSGPNNIMRLLAWQGEAMALNDGSPESWSYKIFIKMMDALEESGIPTLIYLTPLSANIIANKNATDGYSRVFRALKEIKSRYNSETIKFILRVPNDVIGTMEFSDYLHLNQYGQFPDYLADEISSMLEAQ